MPPATAAQCLEENRVAGENCGELLGAKHKRPRARLPCDAPFVLRRPPLLFARPFTQCGVSQVRPYHLFTNARGHSALECIIQRTIQGFLFSFCTMHEFMEICAHRANFNVGSILFIIFLKGGG